MGSAFWRENPPKEGLGGPLDWPGPNIEGVQPNQLPGDHNPPPETKHRCSNRLIADRVGIPSPRKSGRFWKGAHSLADFRPNRRGPSGGWSQKAALNPV